MDYITSPAHVLRRLQKVEGWNLIHLTNLPDIILEVVEQWSSDWSEGEGFGSSDMTFLLKDCIDRLIYGQDLKTVFDPCLKIVKK